MNKIMKTTIAVVGLTMALVLGACAAPMPTQPAPSLATTAAPPATGGLEITGAWARAVNMGGMGGMDEAEGTPGAMDMNTPSAMGMETPETMESGEGGAMAEQMGAVYMNIANSGAADKLIKANTDVANTVELHTVINENGVMQMRPVPAIDVPANGSVELKPGGYHVMLIGVNRQLEAGELITVTLTFENAGEKQVQAELRAQ